jgi:hypothetical protein
MRPIPAPVLDLSFEQTFEMAKITKGIEDADPETLVTVCKELLKHNFLLKSTCLNLVHHWNDDIESYNEGD